MHQRRPCYYIVMCTYLHNINLLHGILPWAAKIVAANFVIRISFQLFEIHIYIHSHRTKAQMQAQNNYFKFVAEPDGMQL